MLSFDQWDILVRVAALVATAGGMALPGGWRGRLAGVARRPLRAGALIVVVSLGVNGAVALRRGMPQPRVHDEFAYLLLADTFAHGRLTNPTPACADSFQSPHVLVRPTYTAKYPPGQGIALAVGQWVGRPIVGVWASAALAALAVAWMTAAFAGAEWALLAGLIAAVHPQVVDWGNVFWGGDVAVLGGALAIGGWARLLKPASDRVGPVAFAVGLLILANSRPYEGLVLALPMLGTLVWRWRGRLVHRREAIENQRVTLWGDRYAWGIAVGVLLLGVAGMGYYNGRVTGHVLRMPFASYAEQFDVYPKFWFLPPRPTPAYPNDVMAQVHTVRERGRYDLLRTWPGRAETAVEWARRLIMMHLRPVILLVPLAASLLVRRAAGVWAVACAFLVGLLAENWFLPHYAAPVVPAGVLLVTLGFDRLARWTGPLPRFVPRLGRGVAVGFFVAAGLSALAPADPDLKRFTRADLFAEQPQLAVGRHLVFVTYEADHPVEDEWVYNGADLRGQRVLWARSLGPAADGAVVEAYGPRAVWTLTIGRSTHRLAGGLLRLRSG